MRTHIFPLRGTETDFAEIVFVASQQISQDDVVKSEYESQAEQVLT
jgi:hypothetical protein